MPGRIAALATPLSLLLVAAVLRAHRIADHNIWWDEGFSVYLARLPLADMFFRTAADVHPPLHYAFLRYWDRLVGESEYAIRYSTLAFGVLDLALVYWLARRYLGTPTALTALLLLTFSRLHVDWSQQIRMYTLAIALALLSTAVFLRLVVDGDRRLRWWLAHACLTVIGLHTIYIFGMVPLTQSLAVAIGVVAPIGGRRLTLTFLARWSVTQAAALVSFLPWALHFRAQPRPDPIAVFDLNLDLWLRAVFTALPTGYSTHLDRWLPLTLAAAMLLLLPPLLERGRLAWLWLISYLALLGGPLALYALSYPNSVLYSPNLSVRYMLLFLPLYGIVLARALVLLARRARPLAILCGAVLAVIASVGLADLYDARRLRDEYSTIASYMRAYARPDDAYALYSDRDWPIFIYYFPDPLRRYGVTTLARQTPVSAEALGREWLREHTGLWLVSFDDAYDVDPDGHLRRWLEAHASVAVDRRVENKRLTLFTTDPGRRLDGPVRVQPRRPLPPEAAPLAGIDVFIREVEAGGSMHLASYWTARDQIQLALVGRDSKKVRVRDVLQPIAPPPGSFARLEHVVPFDPRLPPGAYHVTLGERSVAAVNVLRPRQPPPVRPAAPSLPPRQDVFAGRIALVGAAVDVGPSAVRLRMNWRANESLERAYTAFAQVVGTQINPMTGNRVWSQLDAPPDRARPTDDWLPGDVVYDERTLPTTGLPAGSYTVIVGLYDPSDGSRLSLEGGRDHLTLASLEVR